VGLFLRLLRQQACGLNAICLIVKKAKLNIEKYLVHHQEIEKNMIN
jgi:hypothetical protein